MKDYKLLEDAQIANIVYKVVHQISPKCCSNYAGLNKQEKEQCINKLRKNEYKSRSSQLSFKSK